MIYIKKFERQKTLKYKVGDYVNIKYYVVEMWLLPVKYAKIIEIKKSPNDYMYYVIQTSTPNKKLDIDEINIEGKMSIEEIEEFKLQNITNKYNL